MRTKIDLLRLCKTNETVSVAVPHNQPTDCEELSLSAHFGQLVNSVLSVTRQMQKRGLANVGQPNLFYMLLGCGIIWMVSCTPMNPFAGISQFCCEMEKD
ncbi:unnamed protein product [Protopolystoma xenopodis]|uniref:Uncharacterized protein n=1 Tax=Protopolystoma xenopodis TaxID=117903 RepID=A0A448WQ86_9PLAT|nr:unnamed protein product [Protopolystoma xenopodis]